ncbi:MAG: RNA polymerase sigma-70 factor [Bacteroidales bacterium]
METGFSKDDFSGYISALNKGDHHAFEKLYLVFSSRVYGFAYRFLQDHEGAAEIVQEVFLKIWQKRAFVNPSLPFEAYLFTMTRNVIFNIHRRKQFATAYTKFAQQYLKRCSNETESLIVFRDYQEKIQKIIDTLPTQRQRIFRLSREEGLSHKEIASLTGLSGRTVEAHIRLALQQIRKELNALDMDFGSGKSQTFSPD